MELLRPAPRRRQRPLGVAGGEALDETGDVRPRGPAEAVDIMLVSVTERVREIGLRKALGAPPRAIGRQFLVEASVLGLTGGALGVLVGAVGALVLPPLIDQAVTLSLLATLAALATSLALGVGFGVYPATRAARLAPIDALRAD